MSIDRAAFEKPDFNLKQFLEAKKHNQFETVEEVRELDEDDNENGRLSF